MNTTLAALHGSGHLRRVDAALGEWIASAFPDAPPHAALAAALAARAVADGHSALALERAQAWFDGLAEAGTPVPLPEIAEWRDALRGAPAACASGGDAATTPLVLDPQGRVYLRRYFEYERQLARSLIARVTSADGNVPALATRGDVPAGREEPALDPAPLRALANRFTLVTGGPGTGKTHGVVRMLVALVQQAQARGVSLRIALAAPTGKAAARLAESVRAQLHRPGLAAAIAAQIPRDAQTVHRLVGIHPWSAQPRFDHATPLPFDVVVVDEVSMVDLPLMAKLADAVPATARLVLLGDPDQLSAVEAGNVLGALVEAAAEAPLDACHVALTRSHRFGADSALGKLARAITDGDAVAALVACRDGGEVTLAASIQPRQVADAAFEAYRPLLAAEDPVAALRAARGYRVLTALRHGPTGCLAFDHAIAAQLQRAAGVRADARWWRGRLVLVTCNRAELGLFNGDTGVAWPDPSGRLKVWFEGADGAPRAFEPIALPPCEGAFALTVHKAQGSEFGRVALVTGPDSPVLTRELLYTGVTRARYGITLCTTPDILRVGVDRRTLRMTGLADRLREAAAGRRPIAEAAQDST